MSSSVIQELLDILDLEPLEVNLFRGRSPQSRWQRVFGGQVIGQALVAACRTVEDGARPPHSLHAYFLLGGDPKVPIIYEVDRIRDGKSFTTRRVIAIQHGRAIFSMAVSFHGDEEGSTHQCRCRTCRKPDAAAERGRDQGAHAADCCPNRCAATTSANGRSSCGPVEYGRYLGKKLEGDRFHVWIRATGRLPDEPAIHQCVLAYASDMTLARHRAHSARHAPCSTKTSWRQASTTRCGFIGRSAPTSGCSTPRTVPNLARRARLRPRPDLRQRRHAGRFGGAGRPAAAAPAEADMKPAPTPRRPQLVACG